MVLSSLSDSELIRLYINDQESAFEVLLNRYKNQLFKFIIQGSREDLIIDKMLFAAMIEARSCERFKVLTENIKDEELKEFYKELMISEANHYTTFISFARQLGDPEKVNKRWEEWLEYEGEIIKSYGNKETIHG